MHRVMSVNDFFLFYEQYCLMIKYVTSQQVKLFYYCTLLTYYANEYSLNEIFETCYS